MFTAIDDDKKIDIINPESILCTFDGHTIFSVFWDQIAVYEQIKDQLNSMEFESEEDREGQDRENSYLRRLYRILLMPVGDLQRHDKNINISEKDSDEQNQNAQLTRARKWIKNKIGIRELPRRESIGFKQITRKSLNYSNSRYQDTLIEIAKMCEENSLTDFVGDLQDL